MVGTKKRFRQRLLDWYRAHQRSLPWRAAGKGLPDAYWVMVSEFMLQQTQVKTVVPYFERFVGRFPHVQALAESDEQEVLRTWQGLGYYSRARNLRRAAGEIVNRFEGKIPASVEQLRSLPGIGRYTAGAIASIAYGCSTPIVDGNVARVISRLDLIRDNPKKRKTLDLLWERAEEMVAGERPGDFNSAMMELGATICIPRNPDCRQCPVRMHCAARAAGVQREIPPMRKAMPTPLEKRVTLCVEKDGRWLIEQRPAAGRWASLWQFTTFIAPIRLAKGHRKQKIGVVRHALTHRRYEFTAYRCWKETAIPEGANRRWVLAGELDAYPMSKPQREIARLLKIG